MAKVEVVGGKLVITGGMPDIQERVQGLQGKEVKSKKKKAEVPMRRRQAGEQFDPFGNAATRDGENYKRDNGST